MLNSLRPRQNGRHFPDAIFKWIFLNENVWILIKISLKFVSKALINNIPALARPQWVNVLWYTMSLRFWGLATSLLRPSNFMCCHGFWSTLVQVMTCCLMTPSHYLDQYWLIAKEVLLHSHTGDFTGHAQNVSNSNIFSIYNYAHISKGLKS